LPGFTLSGVTNGTEAIDFSAGDGEGGGGGMDVPVASESDGNRGRPGSRKDGETWLLLFSSVDDETRVDDMIEK
jgi:hypothetical protein